MSNHLAIATVTAALQQRLVQIADASGVSNAFVTTDRPDLREKDKKTGINLFLYEVNPNPQQRNDDLPTRRADGSLARKPQVVLDLYYLLTFHGEDKVLEGQRLLGAVVSQLDARPVLSPQEIKDSVITPAATVPDSDARHFLGESDLAAQEEPVRFTQTPLATDELARLWSLFGQTPYSLSLGLKASVVIIEPKDLRPKPALPVRQPQIYVQPFAEPQIRKVFSSLGEGFPVIPGAQLLIQGDHLRGQVTHILTGGIESIPPLAQITPEQITLTLPGGLKAGLHGVQVVHKLFMGDPAVEHRGFESNVLGLVLHPVISSIAKSGATSNAGLFNLTLTLTVLPLLREGQRLAVLLNRTSGSGEFSFEIPPLPADASTAAFAVEKVPAGEYFVRVQVDGAESSLLDLNPLNPTFGQMTGPRVTIP
jgi:hypothetical protein